MSEVTASHKGQELIKGWQRAVERRKRLDHELIDAKNAERSAQKALADWLAPADAKIGEKFSIWNQDQHGNEALFEVTVEHPHTGGSITVRYRK